jgi:glycosyltransferase 2 family protein
MMETLVSNLNKRLTILQIIGTFVALGLLIILLNRLGWKEIIFAFQKINTWQLLLALFLMSISRFSVIARWHTLLHSAEPNIRLWQTARITLSGLFLTNFLPTTIGGDVVRLMGAIQNKIDPSVSTASLIVDRLIGLTGMVLALPFAIPNLITNQASLVNIDNLNYSFSLQLLIQWQSKILSKILDFFTKVYKAFYFWKNQPTALFQSLIWTIIHMFCQFIIIQILLYSLGESLPLWQIAGFFSLVYLVTLIPISINGYGLQEFSMTFVFSHLGNISTENSISIALLFRTLMILASLPGALFVPSLLSNGLNRKK